MQQPILTTRTILDIAQTTNGGRFLFTEAARRNQSLTYLLCEQLVKSGKASWLADHRGPGIELTPEGLRS